MKIIFSIILVVFFGSLLSQKTYYTNYRPLADSLSSVFQIPACVILSVAYLESGGGKSKVAINLNNHFGIVGKNNLMQTKGIKTKYKYYNSVTDSYIGFCKLVASKKYYAELKGNDDVEKWVLAIASQGYAKNAKKWSQYTIKLLHKNCPTKLEAETIK
jgi:flagellum-specific peptidoglycan hydrolase FlgJ